MDTHNRPPKLMDRVKATMRVKRYSLRTEKAYLNWLSLSPAKASSYHHCVNWPFIWFTTDQRKSKISLISDKLLWKCGFPERLGDEVAPGGSQDRPSGDIAEASDRQNPRSHYGIHGKGRRLFYIAG
ncbi:hypothetical protein [Halomonas sp. 328]|uniref:hypothetical protein n=1 Tax=Halomonas sp. 328 TaxID=2776704 RepID=UPI0018A79792|nr:hypothetical protein [Halomonas sp. 328]MBF8221035.1 hypothetical protein [Halomonas sp. 328]